MLSVMQVEHYQAYKLVFPVNLIGNYSVSNLFMQVHRRTDHDASLGMRKDISDEADGGQRIRVKLIECIFIESLK